MSRFRLLNEAGQVVEVDEAEATRGIVEGRYRASGPIRIRRADGRTGTAQDSARAARALATGRWRLESPELAEETRLQAEYGNSPVTAATTGAARGLTFGASDVIGAELGYREPLAELRERNPIASAGGEIAGAVLPLLVPGAQEVAGVEAAGAGARLLRAVTAPGRALEGLGAAAEAATLARLGEGTTALGRAGRAAMGTAAAGAVEGAGAGVQQAVTETALSDGDYSLLGERLIAGVGLGTALGAGGGGLLGGAMALGAEAPRAVVRSGADLLRRTWAERMGTELAPGVEDVWARMADGLGAAGEVATGGDRRFIAEALGPEGRRTWEAISRGDRAFDDGVRRLSDDVNQVEVAGQHARDFWERGIDRQMLEPLVEGDGARQLSTAATAFRSAREVAERLAYDTAGTPAAAGARRLLADIDQLQLGLVRSDPTGATALASVAGADSFIAVDQLRRSVRRAQGAFDAAGDVASMRAARELAEGGLEPLLRSETLWGRAAVAHADIETALQRFATRRERFVREFLGDAVRDSADPSRALPQADSARLMRMLRRSGTAANDTSEAVFRDVLEGQAEVGAAIARHMQLPPEIAAEVAQSARAVERARATLDDATDTARRINQFRQLSQSGGLSTDLAAFGLGHMLGGPVVGALAGIAANPARSIRVLSALHRISQGVDSKIARSVSGFVRAAFRRAREGVRGAGRVARRAAVRSGVEAYEQRVRELRETSSPQELQRRLAESSADLNDAAPDTRAAVMQTAVRANQFLQARLPRLESEANQLLPGMGRRPTIPQDARSRFMRYAHAVDQPLTVLADLESGTLSPEGVEVLRDVYPGLYQQVVRQVMRELAEQARDGRQIPYHDRLQLGLLLGAPTDPSLRPESVAMLQSLYTESQTRAAGTPAQAPTPQLAEQIRGSMTMSQQISARE